MPTVQQIVLTLLISHTVPGHSVWSVEPACPAEAQSCSGAVRSSHYGGAWVRQETRQHALERYETITQALDQSASELLCEGEAGPFGDECRPAPDAIDWRKRKRWSRLRLEVMAAALAIQESGLREDVQVGRGSSRHASDDGGRGRGPSGEGCLVQPHPASAWIFSEPSPDRELARAGNPDARERLIRRLLGTDQDSTARCFMVGLRMLMHARAHCEWSDPTVDWDFATFSLYGTGTSCDSVNKGKTRARTELFRRMYEEARRLRAGPKEVAAAR
jgi:hypothetical protein